MREKFLCITHTHHLNQTTITSLNTEENEYVTKSNHAFHILHCSVSPSVTKHPQVSRSVTLLFLHTIAIAVRRAAFGQGTGPVFLYNVGCTGNESSLLSCSHMFASCSHSSDAGVVCPPCKSCILSCHHSNLKSRLTLIVYTIFNTDNK